MSGQSQAYQNMIKKNCATIIFPEDLKTTPCLTYLFFKIRNTFQSSATSLARGSSGFGADNNA